MATKSNLFSRLDELLATQASSTASLHSPSSLCAELGAPSVSLAVLDEGEIRTHCISSVSDDVSTRFQACSISKAVTSLGVFKLIELRKLSLHGLISDYLPVSIVDKLEPNHVSGFAQHITIAHLLSHTSGLQDSGVYGYPGYEVSQHGRTEFPTLETIIAGEAPCNTLPIKLKDYPGHRFNYSGGGTMLLQMIMEQVAGKSFPAVMQEYVFEPLGMTGSTFDSRATDNTQTVGQHEARYARAYYSGYTPCEVPYRLGPELAAAWLWSTPQDLLKIGRAVLDSLHGKTNAFLTKSTARTMLTEVQPGMAHSWFVNKETPYLAFRHEGKNMPGWRCNVVCFTNDPEATDSNTSASVLQEEKCAVPKDGCGIAVMTNSAQGAAVYDKILAAICYIQGWPAAPRNWTDTAMVIPFADTQAKVDTKWVLWQGQWEGGWQMMAGQDGDTGPYVSFRGMPASRLYMAARPRSMAELRNTDKASLDLVCSGLEVMFRLMVDVVGDEPVIEIWHGPRQDRRVLRRSKS
ncbi:beta-lactamase [Nannizzia gypsea CBS 118893]|uniref:Beta-lactamase n=1 Tax=Arthroderma gypseum (strain ATCC MYA-4604 / CBS 118893) TaxID=535722 RepID=E4USY7_ARTGP|nr:beta-lactamase [Nannizzia gypsea CBS 118893]EFR00600.1 beta-lactamase [Nannizzia gypsea CBS 118893]